jgi:hypothetical protein
MKKVIAGLVAAISAGWLIPMWFGVTTYLQFWRFEGWPLLLGHPHLNSFDFLLAAESAFKIAFIWLAFVILAWSYVIARHIQKQKLDSRFRGNDG